MLPCRVHSGHLRLRTCRSSKISRSGLRDPQWPPCNAFFPVSEYVWADTDEKIVDYYNRHSTKATAFDRFLCSKVFLIVSVVFGALVGIAIGYAFTRNGALGQRLLVSGFLAFIGVFAAAALNISVVSKAVVKRVCGVADTRRLK